MAQCQPVQKDAAPVFFGHTPVEKLAVAIETEDTVKIEFLVHQEKMNINYQEPVKGTDLLSFAVGINKTASIKKLLILGANPNLRNPIDNWTPFLLACDQIGSIEDPYGVLSLMVHYGADVNSERVYEPIISPGGVKHVLHGSCLQYLVLVAPVECVKLLVDNGARLDIYPKNGEKSIFFRALINPGLDIVHYFLIDKKVPVPDYCVIRYEKTNHPKKITIRQLLKERATRKDQYQMKLEKEILDFLAVHGQ